MLYIIILAIVIVVLLTRHYFLKKEIRHAARQLHDLNYDVTAKKINLGYFDEDIEELAMEINKQIDLTKEAQAEKRSSEIELKQAISYISHDIRTPLTSILGYIHFLESDETTPEVKKEYTGIIKSSARRLKVLLEDFFELSIIEQEDYPVKLGKVDLNSLTLEVLLGFYEEFNQRDLKPAIDIPDRECTITTDPSAARRVIENLIVNAVMHSTGSVSIKLKQTDHSVILIISNSVNQISEQDFNHLFDRFYKADHTRTGSGTGLGLPIAKSLMGKMNGSLTAELMKKQIVLTCEWRY
ncbi:sensor histidine kinase KdpD [Thalassobacillus sp. CUG 92003]|uniref:sensor histidine kinase n=1 Tax=Thalassobacillus sp. CUG 92003 TaxID=2736641 RepID=UPI0015E69088|nr:HAMP domain-containing sensor histidine kinase [Thalassobacillus sp. CUG 92003]